MTNPLNKKQSDLMQKLGLAKARKLLRASTLLYNKLCPKCRSKVIKTPSMSLNNYCAKCRKKAEVLEQVANE